MKKETKKIIAIVGPTASGKSALAIKLAEKISTEIISADSRLVYKKMDIGTAKPSLEERNGIVHHLIDLIEPNEGNYSLGDFIEDASLVIDKLSKENKTPIITGGTGFYFKDLLQGVQLTNTKTNQDFRDSLELISTEELYSRLQKVDNQNISKQMDPNDRYRIIRALEIDYEQKNKPATVAFQEDVQVPLPSQYEVLWFGLYAEDRDQLRERIKKRVQNMLQLGLIDEVESLVHEYGELDILKKTIGYTETINYLNGEIESKEKLEEQIYFHTSQYSKRQMTWFKANEQIHWLNCFEDGQVLLETILEKFNRE